MTTLDPTAVPESRWRPSATASAVALVAVAAALMTMSLTGQPGDLGRQLQERYGSWLPAFVSLQFLVMIPLCFLLEWVIPARPEQRGLGPSVAYDLMLTMFHLPAIVAITTVVAGPLNTFLEENASGLVVDSTRSWPLLVAAVAGVALIDLFKWFSHLVKHKVPQFWRFHMIHHSQTRLSMFTTNRTHPIDALVDTFVMLLPLFILFPSITAQSKAIFVLSFVRIWHDRFQHANIGTNLGPLRWIFVTPQSHRIHHSTEPEHWNSNYATFFAWDRLFGTQHPDDTSYPTTGINDRYFPEPVRVSFGEFARAFVGQLLFPFDGAAVRRASIGSPHDAPSRDR